MRNWFFIFSLLLAIQGKTQIQEFFPGYSSDERGKLGIRIMFYNVENLFDTQDDPKKRDDSFLPEGDMHWNDYKMYDKIKKTSKTILNVGGWEPPAIVGFCELENRFVLDKIATNSLFKKHKYSVSHFESPDRRGIDVGLIYRGDKVKLLYQEPIPIVFPWDTSYKTRDVLYTQFQVLQKDTIHLFVCHWPSKYGGALRTEPARMHVAQVIKEKCDEIKMNWPKANIIIMGDLNDGPETKSVHILSNEQSGLYNLMEEVKTNYGSHKYQSQWSMIDQFIVSESLLNNKGLLVSEKKAFLFEAEYLLTGDEKWLGKKPNRTYLGMKYLGGYSDHLPIYMDLMLQN